MALLLDILAAGIVDSSGVALSQGKAYVYKVGTTSKVNVYEDFDLESSISNPVILDSGGKAEVYVNEDVRVYIEDSQGELIDDIDAQGTKTELQGSFAIGRTSGDILTFNSSILGDLIPLVTNKYVVGNASGVWKEFRGGDFLGNNLTIDGDITISGTGTYSLPEEFADEIFSIRTYDQGTKMLFYQAAAPTGWTLDTDVNDRFIRVSDTAGGVTSGSFSNLDHKHFMFYKDKTTNDLHGGFDDSGFDPTSPSTFAVTPIHWSIASVTITDRNGATETVGTTEMNTQSEVLTHGSAQHAYADVIICTKD